jgi:nicotinamide mononucleotide transporter
MTDWLSVLYQNFQDTTIIEVVAVLFGLLSVWYAKKENILVFPTGIVSVLLYVYICLNFGLYADMGINAFYFGMSVFGWYNWTHQKGELRIRPISKTSGKYMIILLLLFAFFFFLIRFVLINYTDSVVPNIDSLTTAIFLIAMWLMSLKKIENWILWIIGDLISIPLYIYKGLVLTSFQYLVFLIIAITGYFAWLEILGKGKDEL